VLGPIFGLLATKIGLIAVVVTGAVAAFLKFTDAGKTVIKTLMGGFSQLGSEIATTFRGIADALAAGEIKLAAEVLWSFLQLQWAKGIAFLKMKWAEFKDYFIRIGVEAFHGVVAAVASVWFGLRKFWTNTVANLSLVWSNFTADIMSVWNTAVSWVADRMADLRKLFDKSFDADAAKDFGKRQADAAAEAIEARRVAEIKKASKERDTILKQLEAERVGALSAIVDSEQEAARARKDAFQKEIAGFQSSFRKAQAKFAEKVLQARRAKEFADLGITPETERDVQGRVLIPGAIDLGTGGKVFLDAEGGFYSEKGVPLSPSEVGNVPEDRLNELAKKARDGAGELAATTQGAFLTGALQGLIRGGPQERIAKGVEEVAKNTKELNKNLVNWAQFLP
jgi:hypothetical protein